MTLHYISSHYITLNYITLLGWGLSTSQYISKMKGNYSWLINARSLHLIYIFVSLIFIPSYCHYYSKRSFSMVQTLPKPWNGFSFCPMDSSELQCSACAAEKWESENTDHWVMGRWNVQWESENTDHWVMGRWKVQWESENTDHWVMRRWKAQCNAEPAVSKVSLSSLIVPSTNWCLKQFEK